MPGALAVILPPEARDELGARARREGTSMSAVAAEAVCLSLGLDAPPRSPRRYLRDVVPDLAALALERGGVTVDEAADELALGRPSAWRALDRARRAGALSARRAGRSKVLVYRATALGERLARGAAAAT